MGGGSVKEANTLDQQRKCEFCDRTFATIAGLRTHTLRMHDAEMRVAAEKTGTDVDYGGDGLGIWRDSL
jgi:hypothetical protein